MSIGRRCLQQNVLSVQAIAAGHRGTPGPHDDVSTPAEVHPPPLTKSHAAILSTQQLDSDFSMASRFKCDPMSQVQASPEAGVCSPRISHASGILSQDVDTSLASLPSLQSEATNATAASAASAAHDYWACHTAPLPAVQYQAAAQYSPQSTADAVQADPYAEAGQLEAAAHGRLQQLAMNMYSAAQSSLPSCGTSAIADLSGAHSCSHPYGVSTLVDFANAPAYIPAEYQTAHVGQSDPFSMSLQHAAALGLLQDMSSGLNTYKYHNNGRLLSQLHQASCSSEAVSSSVWTPNQHAVPEPYTSLNHTPNLSMSRVNQAPQPASELYGWQVAQAHVTELMMQNA